jgi:hypothetical protein
MNYYLSSGFNILVYGVGSKWNFLTKFMQKYYTAHQEPVMYVNGYHSGSIMKGVVTQIYNYVNKSCDINLKNSKRLTSIND